jgi:hypothetical protein
VLAIFTAKTNACSDIFLIACTDYDELGSLLPEPSPPLCSTFNLSPVHLLLTLCIIGSTAAAAVAISCSTAVSGGVLHVWTVCGSTVGLLIGYTLPAGMPTSFALSVQRLLKRLIATRRVTLAAT